MNHEQSTPLNQSERKQTGRLEPQPYLPDPVMLSRQIDSLHEVIRRMKNPESRSAEALIALKIEQLAQA